jgi:hypothetical protein
MVGWWTSAELTQAVRAIANMNVEMTEEEGQLFSEAYTHKVLSLVTLEQGAHVVDHAPHWC